MFEPRKLRVVYRVEKPDGETVEFDIRLDQHGLLEKMPTQGPSWTRLAGGRCGACKEGNYCRAALAISPVVDAFISLDSLQAVRVRVTMPNYAADVTCSLPAVVTSIMGLLMAGSGCSTMAPFRAMAMHHQPFATLEDTVIRAAGFMLLGRWAHGTLSADNPFAPLIEAWENLEAVNMRIGKSLQAYCTEDGVRNGLANLDLFAKAGVIGLDSALQALRPALLAWDAGLDAVAGENLPANA